MSNTATCKKIVSDLHLNFEYCKLVAATHDERPNDHRTVTQFGTIAFSSDDPNVVITQLGGDGKPYHAIFMPRRDKKASHQHPLAPVKPATLNIPLLKKIARLNGVIVSNEFIKLHSYLTEDTFADQVVERLRHQHGHHQLRKPISRCFIKQDRAVIEAISDEIEPTPKTVISQVFKTSKKPGADGTVLSRFILDGHHLVEPMKTSDNIPKMQLPSLDQAVANIAMCNVGCQFDGESFFNQFEIASPSMRHLHAFRIARGRGEFQTRAMNRMAQGTTTSPAIAQATSQLVIQVARAIATTHIYQDTGLPRAAIKNINDIPWIDNFVFGAHGELSEKLLEFFTDIFTEFCNTIGLRLKTKDAPIKEQCKPSREFSALGVHFNLYNHTVSIAEPKDLTALARKESITLRELLRIFGTWVFHCFVITKTPLCMTPYMFMQVAREAQDPRWDEHVMLLSQTRDELVRIADFLLINEPVCIHNRLDAIKNDADRAVTDVWADASGVAVGGCIDSANSKPEVRWHAPYCTDDPIWMAELFAAMATGSITNRVHSDTPDRPFLLHEDNTVALAVLRKGHASHLSMNLFLRDWISRDAAFRRMLLEWVPSEEQRADEDSRIATELSVIFGNE